MNEIIFQGAFPVVAAATTTGEHLFGLDAQLLFDVLFTGVNVFIMCTLLSFLLFDPARKFLNDRKAKIAADLANAEASRTEAEALKAEYEEKMRNVAVESEEILRDARKRGLENQAQIVAQANADAQAVRARALKDIELEKQHAMDDVKNNVVTLASAIAAKVVSANIDTRVQNELVEETIKELDEGIWQN